MRVKLPLIIVLDGETLFNTTVAALRFMNYSSEMPQLPEAVVVGIRNTERNRDMPIPQQFGTNKGENKFAGFIRDELLPELIIKYPLNGHIIVIGHSQGGYFATYLLSQFPVSFPWIIALDAPMNVDPSSKSTKEKIKEVVNDSNFKTRYASIEAVYGWGSDWSGYFPETNRFMREKLPGESHESMPFKGIYDGLKFLFRDFPPPRSDMKLSELKTHFKQISDRYGYAYEIPLSMLIASATRKLPENRKDEITDLLDYAESLYGDDVRITQLKARASKMSKSPTSLIDSFLALSRPTPSDIKKYAGQWRGQFTTKEGTILDYTIEISVVGDEVKLFAPATPNDPSTREEAEIFHLSEDGRLIFGKRNRGGGIIINTLSLSNANRMTGEGRWLGFAVPDDAPADVKDRLTFLLKTPTKFVLERQ